ncbi:MAG: TIGR01459 family HAD-type hydrolase [Sneathiellales bacterium]|nr:TIGR01459 family HAD-type hydrolase [Sneathiellales bacterium]
MKFLKGLSEIASSYDLFIIDLWGVMHNGIEAYPDAVDCVRELGTRGKTVVFLSNAARDRRHIAEHLLKRGIGPDLYSLLLTSGDVTIDAVKKARKDRNSEIGEDLFHIGPDRCVPTFTACGGKDVSIEDAETILCTGLYDETSESVKEYSDLLKQAVARKLPMVCANPDVSVKQGERVLPGAGALAALYEELGGNVYRFGKPFPYIYDQLFSMYPDIGRERSVMIGDGLFTDIRGARQAGIDAIWIAGGLHAEELQLGGEGTINPEFALEVAAEAGEHPGALLCYLTW